MIKKHSKVPDKVYQAMGLLNEAAHEKRAEVYDALGTRYRDLRKTVADTSSVLKTKTGRIRHQAEAAVYKGRKKIKKSIFNAAENLDRKAHANPWGFMGFLAAGAFVVGYRLSHRKKTKAQAEPQNEAVTSEKGANNEDRA